MEEQIKTLSNKGKIIYTAFELLDAKGIENKLTSYSILDFVSEDEDLINHPRLADIEEQDFIDMIFEMTIKSVNTIIASLCRKGLINKTEPEYIKVDGQKRHLRQYFIPII